MQSENITYGRNTITKKAFYYSFASIEMVKCTCGKVQAGPYDKAWSALAKAKNDVLGFWHGLLMEQALPVSPVGQVKISALSILLAGAFNVFLTLTRLGLGQMCQDLDHKDQTAMDLRVEQVALLVNHLDYKREVIRLRRSNDVRSLLMPSWQLKKMKFIEINRK